NESRLDGEEDVIEDVVDRIEECSDQPAAEEEEDDEGEHAHAVVDLGGPVREEVAENVAAVERRERNEVEDEEQQVDEDDQVEKERDGKERGEAFGGDAGNVHGDGHGGGDGGVSGGEDVFDENEQDEGDGGREQIAGRAGEGDEDVVAAVVFEVAAGDGRGFGPADEEAAIHKRDEREEDRAEGVEVSDGVEGDAAEHFGGGIAEAPCGPGVGALVHAEGEDEDDDFEDDDDGVQRHGGSS